MNQTIPKDIDIQQINTAEQIQSCYKVMRQLRPHLMEEQAFIEQVGRQLAEGYKLACCQEEGKVIAVVGFRFLEFLAWGKVLYIDDLITDTETRRSGHGGKLLKWVIEQAKKEKGADPLRDHLDLEMIKVFVVDHESLILVFQPYAVGGFADGPFTIKIPFAELIGKWQTGNPLEKQIPITQNFLSSWDKDNWISDVQEEHLLPSIQMNARPDTAHLSPLHSSSYR